MKTIKVSDKIWEKLMSLKIKFGAKSVGEILEVREKFMNYLKINKEFEEFFKK